MRVKYSANILSANTPTKANAHIANGKRYSTTDQSPGTNTAPKINNTLILIARVRGRVMRLISAFVFLSFQNSLDFLYSLSSFKFQNNSLKCWYQKNKIPRRDIAIIII